MRWESCLSPNLPTVFFEEAKIQIKLHNTSSKTSELKLDIAIRWVRRGKAGAESIKMTPECEQFVHSLFDFLDIKKTETVPDEDEWS